MRTIYRDPLIQKKTYYFILRDKYLYIKTLFPVLLTPREKVSGYFHIKVLADEVKAVILCSQLSCTISQGKLRFDKV